MNYRNIVHSWVLINEGNDTFSFHQHQSASFSAAYVQEESFQLICWELIGCNMTFDWRKSAGHGSELESGLRCDL